MPKKKNSGTEPRCYLSLINSPDDLRVLPDKVMPILAEEIRAFLIEKLEKSGGHLASNLGVVELTLALHRVFDTPNDHIIWDVGHQTYIHKIITGRRDLFDMLRRPGGLSGFTSRRESDYDPFGAGHSSTSVSAALGFAMADRIAGRKAHTVAVIGDGAFTGGMVHEALNNCATDLPFILILNENEMSISRNTGAFARYIADIRTSAGYMATKRRTIALLHKIPLIGRPLYRFIRRITHGVKRSITKNNYFEALGFLYLGPVDGNNYAKVDRALRQAKARGGAVVLHIKTQKGKGYAPAEKDPSIYHSMAPCRTGEHKDSFHTVFGEELVAAAGKNERICAITAAMGLGCGLEGFAAAHPDRFFDVGIAEEHATTFAAGMAAAGMIPCFAVYSTFLQRAYDNLLHDVALQGLPVKLFIDRAGLAHADGATHHGIFDVSYLSAIPGMVIYAPASYGSLRAIMKRVLASPSPTAVRYPNKAEDPRIAKIFYPDGDFDDFGVRASFTGVTPSRLVVAFGTAASIALDAAELAAQRGEEEIGVLLVEALKPLGDTVATIKKYLSQHTHLVLLEEGIRRGGAAEALEVALCERRAGSLPCRTTVLAIDDHFASPTAPTDDLLHFCGIAAEDVLSALA